MSKANLKRITLHLARTKEFPNGSPNHGYEMVAPLDSKDHIDADAWHKARAQCEVRRFWGSEEESGHLIRKPGGSWAFHYDGSGDEEEDDEAGYRFQSHAFKEGEYVSLKDGDGELHPFIVAYVEDLEA
jgi:hypothetical protein